MTVEEESNPSLIPQRWRIFACDNCTSLGAASEPQPFEFEGTTYYPNANGHWKPKYPEGMHQLAKFGRLKPIGRSLMYRRFLDDFHVSPITNIWTDTKMTGFSDDKLYAMQTAASVIQRCMLMTTEPSDLVLDPVTMEIDKRSGNDVPAWFLDTDYNGLCFHVCQAFFPRTSAWDNLKRALKGDYDESVWEHLAGTRSVPFEAGEHGQIAVKVIDDRGNELMVVKGLKKVE